MLQCLLHECPHGKNPADSVAIPPLPLLQALCTEASLASLRRHYPQIYDADDKLLIDPGRVRVQRRDFLSAFQSITPASHRSSAANARWVGWGGLCGVLLLATALQSQLVIHR